MIPVIDLFAGPGGLNEGFSSVRNAKGDRVFGSVASFEMETNAIMTLRLRATLRALSADGHLPDSWYDFLNGRAGTVTDFITRSDVQPAYRHVSHEEVQQKELGEATRTETDAIIAKRLPAGGPWVLIGGPPCQAYSMAGRSRRVHDETFSSDKKHFLFREYLHIIEKFEPTIFVMENVKGLLSSTHSGFNMFEVIKQDLSCGGRYSIRSLVVPDESPAAKDYVIRSEHFGVPQRRHRVILLGIRNDSGVEPGALMERRPVTSIKETIGDMPRVRSLLSPRRMDSEVGWGAARDEGRRLAGEVPLVEAVPGTGATWTPYVPGERTTALREWLVDPNLECLTLHEPRAHMAADLQRYEYLSLVLQRDGLRPTVRQFPAQLKPLHGNVDKDVTPFLDRFKVQDFEGPSSTITSHMAKDGHYYIHPDPAQMRSLTVREAARLQTFPDNYFFMGNRTAQYHQVGNAVPPFLAKQIGKVVAEALGTQL